MQPAERMIRRFYRCSPATSGLPKRLHRRPGSALAICLTAYLFCGATAPEGCKTQTTNIGPSQGQVVGAIVGVAAVVAVGTVVLVEVHKSHHTVKGCVTTGPDGLQVTTTGDKPRTYLLEGNAAKARAGDLVQMHGDKIKRTKDSTGDQTFMVETIKKDFGPCTLNAKLTPPSP